MNEVHYVRIGEPLSQPHQYTACGLNDVYLLNGYEVHETEYGRGVAIKDLEGLHRAIGLYLTGHKKVLNGKELRFLRVQMDLTQSELGRLVGLSAQQVARWEKEQCHINPPAERLLRMLYQEHAKNGVPIRHLLECLDEMDDRDSDVHVFEESGNGWQPRAA